MSAQKFYSKISNLMVTHYNSNKTGNMEIANIAIDNIEQLVKDHLPDGSGFNSGTQFILNESNRNKLVFTAPFHHINSGGYYDGWTHHKIIVTPDLCFGFNIKITGKNRCGIKDYIESCFTDLFRF